VAADGQVRLQPLFESNQPQFLQAPDFGLGEGCVHEVLERCAAKKRERLAQVARRGLGIAGRTLPPGLLE
jgi:hypothetical protein